MRTGAIPMNKVKRFRRALGARWRNVLDIGLLTGWRISDILGLRPEDIGRGGVTSMTARKTGKVAQATFPVALVRRLRAHSGQFWLFPSPADPSHPLSRQSAYKAFKKASQLAGVTQISPHSMRKTYARAMREAGHTVQEIQAALQHNNPAVTLLYLMDF